MEKEKNQDLEWLEAQKIEISVDLIAAAKRQLQFLGAIDRNRWLYDGPALDKAIFRYNAYWLPLLAKYTDSSTIIHGPLVPPLDCEWVWHCHRLNPVRYKSDCEQFYGRILDNSGVVSSANGNSKSQTESIWRKLYPMEPYDFDLDKPNSTISLLENSTTYDLVSAVKRQSPFYYQVSRSHVDNDIFLQEAVERYKAFLYLIQRSRERSIKLFCVPTYDIDFIWHTHQLHALSYCEDMEKRLGKVLEHDDTDSDRSKGKKLDTGFSGTTSQWEETFGRRYWKAGAMNRGNTPKDVTASPYVCSETAKDEESSKSVIIKCLEVEVTEVILEIVGVKNLPETHKGKVFVVFSKSQPDSLFNAERRLTVLSESCGEKQVALFRCEPKGELCFQLMSSKSKKPLGFASLSLSEFLFPVSKLSVEKWLELTPTQKGQNPICIRVGVSFTPPTSSPSVLRMVQERASLKESCFFPMIRKNPKVFTRVVDETETEVISLEMRNSKDGRREVIGVKESGESYVLAEFDGRCLWSLLDSKWFLKQTTTKKNGLDGPLFEISGTRIVKVYSGRKLEYEHKHCSKMRNDQDFMTAVEFSKEHPYGKAVGLLDLKLGSFEASEEWFVVVGIVSAFILDDLLKKEGFSVAPKEAVKANGTIEESSKETGGGDMVNAEMATTPVMVVDEKISGGGNMVEGGHCGGGGGVCRPGCTGGSTGCANRGGEYDGILKNNANENVISVAEALNDTVIAA